MRRQSRYRTGDECYVYKIEQKSTGFCYIGVTINPGSRWYQHMSRGDSLVSKAIINKGLDDFIFSVEYIFNSQEAAYKKERLLIKDLNTQEPSGFNSMPGGNGNRVFTKHDRQSNKEILAMINKIRG
jgi:predicted GIY-YIG superfamily endonuclease